MSAIEHKAACYFTELFFNTKKLKPAIPTEDKGIITDGHIDVFAKEYNKQTDHSLKDSGYLGRLSVQVKGKLFPEDKNYLTSFELERHDLVAIKNMGGLVLFVAGIPRDDCAEKVPYYADLAVQNVELLLRKMGHTQATLSVKLQKFPTDLTEVYKYVCHFSRRQSEKSIITPDDTVLTNAEGISVRLPHDIDHSIPQIFGGPTDSAIIELVRSGQKNQAIKGLLQIIPEDYLLHECQNLEIKCGDVTFRKTRRRRLPNGKVEHFFSPGISLAYDIDSGKHEFTFRYQANLHYILNDLLFMDALRRGKPIEFNGETAFQFRKSRSKKLKQFLSPLEYLQDLKKMCITLGLDPKLCRIADLSESASTSLRDICLCLFHGAIFDNKQGIPLRQEVDLGGSKIELMWALDEKSGRWLPTGFFDTTKHALAVTNRDTDSKQEQLIPVTPYEFFNEEGLGEVLNLYPDLVVSAYRNLHGEHVVSRANQTVLNLISSADRFPSRRYELLEMALSLNSWTLEIEEDCLHYKINRFQIIKRLGNFTEEERNIVRIMWKNACQMAYGDDSLSIEIATSILLDEPNGIEYLLNKMSDPDRGHFTSLPIFYLHKNCSDSYVVTPPNNDEEWSRVEARIECEEVRTIAQYIHRN